MIDLFTITIRVSLHPGEGADSTAIELHQFMALPGLYARHVMPVIMTGEKIQHR